MLCFLARIHHSSLETLSSLASRTAYPYLSGCCLSVSFSGYLFPQLTLTGVLLRSLTWICWPVCAPSSHMGSSLFLLSC